MSEPTTVAEEVSEKVFRQIVESLLFPLFPGTNFTSDESVEIPKRNRSNLVTRIGSDLKLMPHANSKVCLRIHRAQVFVEEEKNIIYTFLKLADRAYRDWETSYGKDTAASVMSEVVAGSVASDNSSGLVGQLIAMLISWSQQTYEGGRITFSLGFDPKNDEAGITFADIKGKDFLKVLSNGQDTLLVVNKDERLVCHETLRLPSSSDKIMSPIRLEGVAQWTSKEDSGRIAITLNRNGEILVFKQGTLLFARRRGDWRYFAHNSVIKSFVKKAMATRSSLELREEIYRTSLDAAFARTGACIGVMIAAEKDNGLTVIQPRDQLLHPDSDTKAKAIAVLIGDEKFQDLDRRLRLELVSIDGATVLDHQGTVLAVGAILKIEGGSASGGGREAASAELAKYGLGIKVSNDGYIKARNREKTIIVEMA